MVNNQEIGKLTRKLIDFSYGELNKGELLNEGK